MRWRSCRPGSKFRRVDPDEIPSRNTLARRRGLDHFIGGRVAEQRLESISIHLVTAAVGPIAADERSTGERQVANRIECLVAHELVLGVAQAFDVDNGVVVRYDDRILKRRTKRVAGGPK